MCQGTTEKQTAAAPALRALTYTRTTGKAGGSGDPPLGLTARVRWFVRVGGSAL